MIGMWPFRNDAGISAISPNADFGSIPPAERPLSFFGKAVFYYFFIKNLT